MNLRSTTTPRTHSSPLLPSSPLFHLSSSLPHQLPSSPRPLVPYSPTPLLFSSVFSTSRPLFLSASQPPLLESSPHLLVYSSIPLLLSSSPHVLSSSYLLHLSSSRPPHHPSSPTLHLTSSQPLLFSSPPLLRLPIPYSPLPSSPNLLLLSLPVSTSLPLFLFSSPPPHRDGSTSNLSEYISIVPPLPGARDLTVGARYVSSFAEIGGGEGRWGGGEERSVSVEWLCLLGPMAVDEKNMP